MSGSRKRLDGDGRPATARCPICGRPADPSTRPFCSRRCKLIDLGRWIDGSYRIPTGEPPDGEPEPDDP